MQTIITITLMAVITITIVMYKEQKDLTEDLYTLNKIYIREQMQQERKIKQLLNTIKKQDLLIDSLMEDIRKKGE